MSAAPEALRELLSELGAVREENRALFQRLADSERRFRGISRGVLRAEEGERARLSRDLHDGLGQGLTAVKIQLEMLEREAPPALSERLAAARQMVADSLADVRQLSRLLRPRLLDELGLAEALRSLARGTEERTTLRVGLELALGETPLDDALATLAFRVTQEALTNVLRHAEARHASVRVSRESGHLFVRVEDDGRGFPVERMEGTRAFGLPGLRDRLGAFGGKLSVRSRQGSGTVLEAIVPLEDLP